MLVVLVDWPGSGPGIAVAVATVVPGALPLVPTGAFVVLEEAEACTTVPEVAC